MNPSLAVNLPVAAAEAARCPGYQSAMLHSRRGELSWQLSEREISGLRLDLHEAEDQRRLFPTATLPLRRRIGTTPPPAIPAATRSAASYATRKSWSACRRPGMPASVMRSASHYWELFVSGPVGTVQPFDSVRPERPRSWTSACSTRFPLPVVEDYILFSYVPGVMPGMLRARSQQYRRHHRRCRDGCELPFHQQLEGSEPGLRLGQNRSDDRAMPQIPPEGRLGLTYERDSWSTSGLWRVVAARTVLPRTRAPWSAGLRRGAGFGVLAVNGAYRLNKNFSSAPASTTCLDKAYSELNLAGSAGFADYGLEPTSRVNEPGRTCGRGST